MQKETGFENKPNRWHMYVFNTKVNTYAQRLRIYSSYDNCVVVLSETIGYSAMSVK